MHSPDAVGRRRQGGMVHAGVPDFRSARARPRVARLVAPAFAQTKITIGKVARRRRAAHRRATSRWTRASSRRKASTRASSSLVGRALVTAGLTGNVDFMPIPSGGAQAVLTGAENALRGRPVAEAAVDHRQRARTSASRRTSRARRWATRRRRLRRLRRGRRPCCARFFKMEVGKDYKVISFQGEPERIAALLNGDIQGALVSVAAAPARDERRA